MVETFEAECFVIALEQSLQASDRMCLYLEVVILFVCILLYIVSTLD